MSRSRLPNPRVDLVTDSGAVLFSLIMGEQLEYPINLDTLPLMPDKYDIRAVMIEAMNIPMQTDKPSAMLPGGIRTPLTVRSPVFKGTWNPIMAYAVGEMIVYNNVFYIRANSNSIVDSTPPNLAPFWVESNRGRTYLQLPKTIGRDWAVQPTVGFATYGFIEVEVSERGGPFPRTWKPVRGMVEILFSPTLEP